MKITAKKQTKQTNWSELWLVIFIGLITALPFFFVFKACDAVNEMDGYMERVESGWCNVCEGTGTMMQNGLKTCIVCEGDGRLDR